MSMESVMAESDAKYKAAVIHATWGHLDPAPGVTYKGQLIAAYTDYGESVVIGDKFEGIPGGPLFYAEVHRLADEMTRSGKVGIYKFTGTYKVNTSSRAKNHGRFIGTRTFTPVEKMLAQQI